MFIIINQPVPDTVGDPKSLEEIQKIPSKTSYKSTDNRKIRWKKAICVKYVRHIKRDDLRWQLIMVCMFMNGIHFSFKSFLSL